MFMLVCLYGCLSKGFTNCVGVVTHSLPRFLTRFSLLASLLTLSFVMDIDGFVYFFGFGGVVEEWNDIRVYVGR